MKILILILARGGSKRLPKKNLKIFGNIPLIQWTIDFAKQLDSESIMLSTDDKDLYKIGKNNNILVPWLRPKNLSSDKTKSAHAAIHAVNWYEKKYDSINAIILLQPTSPFRNLNEINRGITNFKKNSNPIIAVYSNKKLISGFAIKNKNGKFLERKNNYSNNKSKIYCPTGSFYMISPKDLRENESFYTSKTRPLIINKIKYQIDIDTLNDFNAAKKWISK